MADLTRAPSLGAQDLNPIYSQLSAALSQDPSIRQPAETALKELARRVGFCSCLSEIIANRSADAQHEVRWLATVYFKNSIARHWRARSDLGITSEEKLHLRTKVLELVREDSHQVAIQIAIILAKIARLDYPKDWANLFPLLMGQLDAADGLATQRVYLCLHHVLKELSTKRLLADQKNFAEIAHFLFDHVWGQWNSDTRDILAAFAGGGEGTESAAFKVMCERWRFCLKALRRLVCFGHAGDARTLQEVAAVAVVMPALLAALQQLLPYWVHVRDKSHPLHNVIAKGILKLIKTAIEVQTTHPWSCTHPEVVPRWLQFCFEQVCAPAQPRFNGFLILTMVLLQNALKFMHSNATALATQAPNSLLEAGGAAAGRAEKLASLRGQAARLYSAFFDTQRIMQLGHAVITQYLPLTAEDLHSWAADPEGYYHEQDILSYKDSLRPCAETLLLIAMQSHRDALAPSVVHLLNSMQAQPPAVAASMGTYAAPSDGAGGVPMELLSREAVYNTVGIGAYELHEYVDFAGWFHSHLVPELQDRHASTRPVRRRAAWTVGCWVAKISPEMRPTCYKLLIALMEEADMCVQLAAVNGMRALVEDWGFCEGQFLDFAAPCFERLFALLDKAAELDSQLQVFNLVYILIERLGDKVRPYANTILKVIPMLWEQADGQSLLRVQLVQSLQHLVSALGNGSQVAYPILLPLLSYCTDPRQPEALNLLEDGLQLWHETISQAPNPEPQLLLIFPNLPAVMALTTEHVKVCLSILESYVLLQGAEVLRQHGAAVVEMLAALFGAVNERATMLIFPVLDTLLQCFPAEGPVLLEPVLLKLLGIVLGGQESDMIVASASGVLSRVLLQNGAAFGQLMTKASATPGLVPADKSSMPVLLRFVDIWVESADSLCTTKARKLTALALCTLLVAGVPQVLERLEGIFSICTSVVYEMDGDSGTVPPGYDYWVSHGAPSDADDRSMSGESLRRKQLDALDPVTTLNLRRVLGEKLAECSTVYGESVFASAVNQVDPAILKQLQETSQSAPASASGE